MIVRLLGLCIVGVAGMVFAQAEAFKGAGPAAELSWPEALERFRKLSPAERLLLAEKAGFGDLGTQKVTRAPLVLEIIERGSLEAATSFDIVCQVKPRTKDSPVAATIKWVIDQGTFVKKGDKLIELDDSGLQEQLKEQQVKVDKANTDLVQAELEYRIQESRNESLIEGAMIARDLAAMTLEKYQKGDYEQALKDVEGRIETANSALALQEDRASLSEQLFKKGKLEKSKLDREQVRKEALRIALGRVLEEKRVLEQDTKQLTLIDLRYKKTESERALARAKLEAKAKIVQAEGNRVARKSIYEQEDKRRQELVEEIRKCVLQAPAAGLVVYYIPEGVRFQAGSPQAIVAQGEPVREGQKLLVIVDLSQMQVVAQIHEALVSHLRDEDPSKPSEVQRALIRVDAVPGRVLAGHVKTVATIASQADWLSAHVKRYKTIVTIDDALKGLRPGMSAEVRIVAERTRGPVLQVPLQSVLAVGKKRLCFVVGDGELQAREIVIGLSNDRAVEIKSGLEEGEKVLLAPRSLVRRLASALGKGARPAAGQGRSTALALPSILVRSVKPVDDLALRRSFVQAYGLTHQDRERMASLPGVVEAVPVRSFPQEVWRLHQSAKARVMATTPEYADLKRVSLGEGRFLSAEDDIHARNVAVLGSALADQLFPGQMPLAGTVRLGNDLYTVVGVLRQANGATDLLATLEADYSIYLPLRTCQARFGERVILRQGGSCSAEAVALHAILVTVGQPADVSATVANISDLLEQAHPRKDWSVQGPPES